MEQLSTMRTEILKLYSQPGGSIAVQKSQLVNLTPKEILDLADSSFGQLHSLVACLEAPWHIGCLVADLRTELQQGLDRGNNRED